MSFQKILLCAIGLYFFYTGIFSGSWGSALIGVGLAVIAFYVAFTGRVHKKFSRRAEASQSSDPMDPAKYRDPDDQQFLDMVHKIKKRLTHQGPETEDDNTSDF